MSNTTGDKIKCTVFGQSHSPAIGVVIEGLPAGITPDYEYILRFMARRAPGSGAHTTSRREADKPEIVSGLAGGVTCGAPLCALIRNTDIRPGDYSELARVPRPGHADYTAWVKYAGSNDISGGGQFSGRLTAPLCFAGALCMQLLEKKGIRIAAHISELAGIPDAPVDPNAPPPELYGVAEKSFPTLDDRAGGHMLAAIAAAANDRDSVGGVIECFVTGLEAGLGEPMFDGVESALSAALFGIPAIKGIEFGAGFELARMRASESNDPFVIKDGRMAKSSNNSGGILGGITDSSPIVFRCAIKPTPSIAAPQHSVNLETMSETELSIKGRHDPCIVPRALPAVEAVTAITIINMI